MLFQSRTRAWILFIKLVDIIDGVKMEKALYYNIILDKIMEHWTFELNEWIYVAEFLPGFSKQTFYRNQM